MKRLNKKGFTLVELLAVVVVLAIVAAIAMRSITGIINNNRIDSFRSSVNSAIEAAQLSCVQDGDVSNIASAVEGKSVTVAPAAGAKPTSFTITADPNGEFKNIKGGDSTTISRLTSGVKGLDTTHGDSITCNAVSASDNRVTCTVNYTYSCNLSR